MPPAAALVVLRTFASPARELRDHLCLPEIDDEALAGVKLSDVLPRHLTFATLMTRQADNEHAAAVLAEPVRFERGPGPLRTKSSACLILVSRPRSDSSMYRVRYSEAATGFPVQG